jgi:acyl-CoA thioesterase FadM
MSVGRIGGLWGRNLIDQLSRSAYVVFSSPAAAALAAGLVVGYVADFTGLLFDLEYQLRMALIPSRRTISSFDTVLIEHKRVLPSDIDHNGHMNNARYTRELNFTRRRFFYAIGLWPLAKKSKLNLIVQAHSIRYRRELKCWQQYAVHSRIVCWDEKEKCIYFESKFLDSDGFVCVINFTKYRIVGPKRLSDPDLLNPTVLLQRIGLVPVDTSADRLATINQIPEDVRAWIQSQHLSSKALNPTK